jgi:hypothetical protein
MLFIQMLFRGKGQAGGTPDRCTVLHLHRVSMWRELAVALRFQALSAFFAFEIATYQLPAHFALGLTANRGFTSTDR